MEDDLIGEAPCEFCGDLYPLMLLIEHQTTHLEEYQDVLPVQRVEVQQDVPKKASVISAIKVPIKSTEVIQPRIPAKSSEVIQATDHDLKKLLDEKKLQLKKNKDFTIGDAKHVMVYDSEPSVEKNMEKEIEEKDTEDPSNLSDDECSECLEEFWKRARDQLKQGRVKIES